MAQNYCRPYYCYDRITDASTQYHLNLSDDTVSYVSDDTVSYGGWWEVGFGCWMTGGSSGVPVFEYWNGRWYVNGVNSHLEPTGAPTYSCPGVRDSDVCFEWARGMWSPYFNGVIGTYWST